MIEEAPAGAAQLEITVLLPLQLKEGLAKDPVRIILEARRDNEAQAQPFDAAMRGLGGGFAVGEDDERVYSRWNVSARTRAEHTRSRRRCRVATGKQKRRPEVRAIGGTATRVIFSAGFPTAGWN